MNKKCALRSVALLWCWWTERNKANRGEKRQAINELQYSVRMHTAEWRELLMKKPTEKVNTINTWEAPPVDWVLINSDGAFLPNQNKGGWVLLAEIAMATSFSLRQVRSNTPAKPCRRRPLPCSKVLKWQCSWELDVQNLLQTALIFAMQ